MVACVQCSVKTAAAQRRHRRRTLKHVGENLYRSDASETYYAIFKRNGKQIRRSLDTTDKDLARIRGELITRDILSLILPHVSDRRQQVLVLLMTGGGVREAAPYLIIWTWERVRHS
jgi:hypothetical protein